ncbi:MAG: response regulator [Candidatus Pristimantibacillus sp.]
MYKILLVDDEAVVREGIRERMSWEELGFDCVGDCENGVDALEAVERLHPNVVLTDINMPFMDGLELTRRIMDKFPETKIIILTGYDDFDYAQKAVKLKVNDFILKPITAAELTAVLHKLRNELDAQRQDKEDQEKLKRQLYESMPVLRERFLDRLATMTLNQKELEERIRYFDIHLDGPNYMTMAIDLDRLERNHSVDTDRELLRFAVYNIAQEIVGAEPSSAVFRSRDEKIMAILSGDQVETLYERVQELAEQIRQSAYQFLKLTVSVGIGTPCSNLQQLKLSSKAAVAALDYRLLLGDNRVISILDMENRRTERAGHPTECDRELISGIKTGTNEEVERAIEGVIAHNRTASLSIDQCYIRIQRTIIAVIQALDEIGCTDAEVFGPGVNPITEIYQFRTLDEIGDWLKSACQRAVRNVSEARNDQCRTQMSEALHHIHEHYDDVDLSVKAVCKRVHMSVSYFSAAFKSETGKTFVEYLTAVRLEKAKELLKFSGMRTYEIAAKTGYNDPQYFSVLFKKHTGESPTEYRQKTGYNERQNHGHI